MGSHIVNKKLMHTFYVPRTQIYDDSTTVVGSEHHHLRNVLRLELGETIRIIDGEGSVITATISKIETELTFTKIEKLEYHDRTTPSITLFQGIPKHDKMELILQKTTELGVTQIVPIITERSLQKPSKSRLERWHRIMLSATKQCGRAWIPELNEIQTLQGCLDAIHTYDCAVIFWEIESERHIQSVLRKHPEVKTIALIVGPEGGFTDDEVKDIIEKGCIPVKIGSTILRTETAAIAGMAMTVYEYKL